MAGHVDNAIVIPAPLELVWRVSNELERWDREKHREMDAEDDGLRVTFKVTHRDPSGRTWPFSGERCLYPESQTVFARRWGNPHHRYSVAWWLYTEEDGGTKVRCVQDFEMTEGSPAGDREMESIMEAGTRAALGRMAARFAEKEIA